MANKIRETGGDLLGHLLPGLKRQDPEAQSKFLSAVGRTTIEILRVKFLGTLNWQDCEDVAAEAGLKFFRSIDRFDPARGTRLETWFLQIALNAARDECRRRKVRKQRELERWDFAPSNPTLRKFFRELIGKLTQSEREYLLLWRFDRGLPAEEIRLVLGLNPGAARKRKHDVLTKLEKLLKQYPELMAFLKQLASGEVGGLTTPSPEGAEAPEVEDAQKN